ncbi:MAG: aminotransferase class I/II-fold pyridoxal phosphate-dependent enzyme, partial [Acidimicrobiia bacterium]|nr:aminotransferase class I/II-fold pyridoxal phosphate-dependent enzyme [Acidimicrobiia bacterium]
MIYLSPPDVSENDRIALNRAFDSGWIAPLGPEVNAFEADLAAATDRKHGVALSSGTGGLHLALHNLGVGRGDRVLVPSLTFAATANAVAYVGAESVFVDCEPSSWNIDPDLIAEAFAEAAQENRQYDALITVDLYGQCADYDRIEALCAQYDVPLIEDAAEALGATYRGRAAGSFGTVV